MPEPKLNSLYCGDCLDVIREWPAGCVDLIYLDPPFNSDSDYNVIFGKQRNQPTQAQFLAFEDTWSWDGNAEQRVAAIERAVAHPANSAIKGLRVILAECGMLAYVAYMAERLVELKRILKPTGTIYLHCDKTASHYLKIVMDAVFGGKNFRSEIHWYYYNKMHDKRKKLFAAATDTLFMYVKDVNSNFTFKQVQELRDKPKRQLKRRKLDGKMVNVRDDNGQLVYQTRTHRTVDNVWRIPMLQPRSRHWLNYKTQKHPRLLERVLEASSNPGDVVLDPFCGCGTTVQAASKMKRAFIGIDISHYAIDSIVRRKVLQDPSIAINGFPVDLRSAELLASESPFAFEKWAITRIPGMVPNEVQVGDGGIDGRGTVFHTNELVLSQVKGGRRVSVENVRSFCHVLEKEKAGFGVFTTLEPLNSPGAKASVGGIGTYRLGASTYPRAQLWSIADYFEDKLPRLPPLADPYNGREIQDFQDLAG